MPKPTYHNPNMRRCHPLLPWFLRTLAFILFFYWGLTHLINPEWYLVKLMGINQFNPGDTYDMWSANLMGVLNVALAITLWRAASDPVKFRIIIDMVLMVSIGTMAVFVIYLISWDLAKIEWLNTALIAVSTMILFILYPRSSTVHADNP